MGQNRIDLFQMLDDRVEILAGLASGERVVMAPSATLASGMSVVTK